MRYSDDVNFREGVRLFNEGKFFDAHEAWERLWRRTAKAEQERAEIQGLIQLAAAGHHLGKGTLSGARECVKNAKKHLGAAFPELIQAIEQAVESNKPASMPKIVPLQGKPSN